MPVRATTRLRRGSASVAGEQPDDGQSFSGSYLEAKEELDNEQWKDIGSSHTD
jgi:hypothetical protein